MDACSREHKDWMARGEPVGISYTILVLDLGRIGVPRAWLSGRLLGGVYSSPCSNSKDAKYL
jgi:hypothetical protein